MRVSTSPFRINQKYTMLNINVWVDTNEIKLVRVQTQEGTLFALHYYIN